MDYTELQQAIQDYLVSDEPAFQQQLPSFVRTAERRIYLAVRTPESRATATGTLSASTLTAPSDFISPLQFIVTISGVPTQLLLKEPSFITEAYPVGTGNPRYYALLKAADFNATTGTIDTTIVFGPAPSGTFSYELRYVRTPPSIVDNVNTWLGINAHDVLLYESLVEGATFLKMEQPQVDGYKAKAAEAMARLKRLCEGLEHMDAYRNPEPRAEI